MVVTFWVGLVQAENLPLAVQPHRHSWQPHRATPRVEYIKGEFKASAGGGQAGMSLRYFFEISTLADPFDANRFVQAKH